MKKIFLMNLVLLVVAANAYGQHFRTYFFDHLDFNHYSIEFNEDEGTFLAAGTVFDNSSNQTDMHILKMDINGNLIWQQRLNISPDDRLLDLTIGRPGEFAVTGYTEASGNREIFVAVLDIGSGATIALATYNVSGSNFGTNIIYSQATDMYYLGGFADADPSAGFPLSSSTGLLMELDPSLGVNWIRSIYGNSLDHSSVNDIVEVDGGLFVTGSISFTGSFGTQQQGVLAAFFDYSGNLLNDLSFESTNSEHDGVSAVYESGPNGNWLWLMSNNSVVHNPQITLIEVGSSPASASITDQYYLELDPSYGQTNAAGFRLLDMGGDELIAAGLFRTYPAGDQNSQLWIARFSKFNAPGNTANYIVYDRPSPGFYNHGGGLLSTFSGEHPYIFEQELICPFVSDDGIASLAFMAPNYRYGLFCLDFGQTDMGFAVAEASGCFTSNQADIPSISESQITAVVDIPGVSPNGVQWEMEHELYVEVSPCDIDGPDAFKRLRVDEVPSGQFEVAPNPTSGNLHMMYSEEYAGNQFVLTNNLGQQVCQGSLPGKGNNYRLDLSDLPAGIYYLRLESRDGTKVKQIVRD